MQRSRTRKYLLVALGAFVGLTLVGTACIVVAGLKDHLGKADIGLVLGSKVELDGTPSPSLRGRLDETVDLYRDGYFPRVIASGGVGKEGYDEALVMKDYLVSHGVPQGRVIVDSGGATTFASARNTLQIVRRENLKSVFVISQYFHLPRARMALRRFGISQLYSAHAHLFEARDIYSAPREVFGYLSYLFRHYDSEPQGS